MISDSWASIVLAEKDEVSVAEAALVIAQDEYPHVVVGDYIQRLDQLADRIAQNVDPGAGLVATLSSVNRCLFEDEGYDGNRIDYYDPRNSYLNEVMDRHLGIPITLSVIYIEIGQRLNMPVSGVGFPGHFLVKWSTGDGDVIVDPYSKGERLGVEQLNRLLRGVYGDVAPTVNDAPELLAPASKKDILVRILRNLKQIYQSRHDRERTLRILEKLLAIDPVAGVELRERASLYEQFDCYRAAIQDLERFREISQLGTRDADDVETALRRLRRMLSSYH